MMRARMVDGICRPGYGMVLLTGAMWLLLWHAAARAQDLRWQRDTEAGRQALTHGDYAEAERHFQGALSVAENLPPDDPRLATSLSNMATLYHTQGQYAQAEALYQRLLPLHERLFGPTHAEVADVLERYATLLRSMHPVRSRFPWSAASRMVARAARIREQAARRATATSVEVFETPSTWWFVDEQRVFSDP